MRVSSGMMFDAGLASIQKQTYGLFNTQQQASTGRRILTPADDPVAAARALEVEQSQAVNDQYLANQKAAADALKLVESTLASAGELIDSVRVLAVQGGNAALSDRDRKSIATELRQRFDELMGMANTTDGTGQYLLSGYQSATKPFSGNVDAIASASGEASYAGDDGQRLMQVSASRQMAVSAAGSEVFMRIRDGNGTFSTAAAAGNTGSGLIDAGSVLDPALWAAGGVPATGLKIVFSVAAGVTSYDIQDAATGTSLLTAPIAYVPGQAIPLLKQTAPAADYGSQVVISGAPADGDTFTITPSSSQSLFKTLADLIAALETPVGTGGTAALTNRLGSALANLDQAQDNILRVRAAMGASLNELDSLASAGEDLGLQYSETLSRLQDLDYAEALTRLTRQKTSLEAAQKSFVAVSGLSLFNYV
jgi:flagellar hook-associated protein 3 FlgL